MVTQSVSSTPGGPVVVVVTSSAPVTTTTFSFTPSSSEAPSSTTSTAATIAPTSQPSSGPSTTTTIAVAVVVPLVAVALLVLGGLFFWRKRKQRKNNEEMRKAEYNDYIYNPNNEPSSGGMSPDGTTVKEGGQGYRGWGNTTTRKMSASMSSPPSGMARSNSGNQPDGSPHGTSEGHSGDPLVDPDAQQAETVGALGAAPVAGSRSAGVNRGPSNASSAYSGANRSDTSALSGEGAPANHVASPQYYGEAAYPEDGAHDSAWGGQPVIRDVSARRNTRIENPSVFPQQGNSGIAQNF